MQKMLILLLLAALLLATSGCTESAPAAAPPPAPVSTTIRTTIPTYHPTTAMPTLEATPSVNDNTITITRDGFSPEIMVVKHGATVRWVNMDTTEDALVYNPTHRIRIQNIKDGQIISPGQGWSWIFTNQGTFDYVDMVHPELHGTVKVEW